MLLHNIFEEKSGDQGLLVSDEKQSKFKQSHFFAQIQPEINHFDAIGTARHGFSPLVAMRNSLN